MALQTDPVAWDAIENALHTSWIVAATGLDPTRVIWSQQGGKRPDDGTGKRVLYIALNIELVEEVGIDWTDWEDNQLSFSDLAISAVNPATDALTVTAHGLVTGDGPVQLVTSGAVPGGLATATNYWVIAVDPNTLKLAATFEDAIYPWDSSAPRAVDVLTTGSGTTKVISLATTERKGQELIARVRGQWLVHMNIQCFGTAATGTADAVATLGKVMMRARSWPIISALNTAGIGISDFSGVKSIGSAVSKTVFEPRASLDVKFFVAPQVEDYQTYIARVRGTNLIKNTAFDVRRDHRPAEASSFSSGFGPGFGGP